VILPHGQNLFQQKVPAAVFVGNGFGKLAGSTQIEELGNIETPIALTNTLSVPDDYVITFSTAYLITNWNEVLDPPVALVSNDFMSSLFTAVVEATEEAVVNSLLKATPVTGREGHKGEPIPVNQVIEICKKYNVLNIPQN